MSNLYLNRYASPYPLLDTNPVEELAMVIVIPVYNEPDILSVMESLSDCTFPQRPAEIIIVINQSDQEAREVVEQNRITQQEAEQWISRQGPAAVRYHVCNIILPKKHAGVGSARKAGMDEAVRRFELSQSSSDGIIVNLDADCTVDTNYLVEIERHFLEHGKSPGASIYFEHPLRGKLDRTVYEGIRHYELFLRYYRQGLYYCNFPYHYHTVGSSMAVRNMAYQKQGGMNRRKAGEDFYFLYRIMTLGNFTEINSTVVRPSPRASARVPFGTGKAINQWLKSEKDGYLAYHPSTFEELRQFFELIPEFYKKGELDANRLTLAIRDFLESEEFSMKRILNDSSSLKTFMRKFYEWFNGFRVLKFVHFCRDHYYPQQEIHKAATALLKMLKHNEKWSSEPELLEIYRKRDRGIK